MKKSELVKIIRTAVRQEINESLPKLVSRLITESQASNTINPVDIAKTVLKSDSKVVTQNKKKVQKKYSNNEALNQVLNETVGGIPQEGAAVSSRSDQVTDFHGQAVDVEELPDHVSNALTRNYSDVLKLVDKKRGKSA